MAISDFFPLGFPPILGDTTTSETILGNIRLWGGALAYQDELLDTLTKIKGTQHGSALFTTDLMNDFGLNIYLTSSGSQGGFSVGYPITPVPRGPILFFNPADANPADPVKFIDENGNVSGYTRQRLILHEFIHAATGLTDNPGNNFTDLLAEYSKEDPNTQGDTVRVENPIAKELDSSVYRMEYTGYEPFTKTLGTSWTDGRHVDHVFLGDKVAGDTITSITNGVDLILGSGGRDQLEGGSGNDWLYGGIDNDILNGGVGDDHIFTGDGDDLVVGSAGSDVVDDGEINGLPAGGNDTITYRSNDATSVTPPSVAAIKIGNIPIFGLSKFARNSDTAGGLEIKKTDLSTDSVLGIETVILSDGGTVKVRREHADLGPNGGAVNFGKGTTIDDFVIAGRTGTQSGLERFNFSTKGTTSNVTQHITIDNSADESVKRQTALYADGLQLTGGAVVRFSGGVSDRGAFS